MNVKKIVFGAIALMVITSCGKQSNPMMGGDNKEPQPYKTQVLAEQDAQLESVYPVTIKGKDDVEIRPRIDGFIDAIYIEEGSVVKKGQSLFLINSPSATQALTTAQAQIESTQAQVNTAQLNVDRIKPLADKGIVSATQLETYQNALLAAKAGLAQAKAQLNNAQATVSWTKVISPVDGVIGSIPFRQGSLVNSSNILTMLANTSNVFAYFSLNEKALTEFLNVLEGKTQAEKIKNSPEITLTLANGSVYEHKGKLETITGVVNVTTGSASFRAEFPNAHGELRSGSSGKVSIPRTLHNVFVIPQESTFALQDKLLVYKVQGDSVVQKTILAYPMPDGKNYAVTQGLESGDRIVTNGVATLSNGTKIIAE